MIDSSGNEAHGTADTGLATQSPVTGVINNALDFGSSGMQLDVNAGAYSEFTISGWLYLHDQSNVWSTVIGYEHEWGINTYIKDNRREIGVWNNNKGELLGCGDFLFNEWFHFAILIQESTVYTYLDGEAGPIHPVKGLYSNEPIVFDIFGQNSLDQDFYEYMDEMRLTDSPQSRDWIRTEYLNQSSPSTFCILGTEDNLQ